MDFLKSTISLEASLVWRYLDFKGAGIKWVLHRAECVDLLLNKMDDGEPGASLVPVIWAPCCYVL